MGAQKPCLEMFVTARFVMEKHSGNTYTLIGIKMDNSACSHHNVITSNENE